MGMVIAPLTGTRAPPRESRRGAGLPEVLLWAFVSDEVEARLAQGITKLRPQDWKSGDKLWIVEAIAPFGGAEEMVRDLKTKVFASRELHYLATGEGGRKDVRVVR